MRGTGPGGRDLTDFEAAVLGVLTGLREGDVVTYGEVAAEAGRPGAHRAVGSFLRRSSGLGVPWWRVVAASGRLVPGLEAEQARRLAAEGVEVRDRLVVAVPGRGQPTDGGPRR